MTEAEVKKIKESMEKIEKEFDLLKEVLVDDNI